MAERRSLSAIANNAFSESLFLESLFPRKAKNSASPTQRKQAHVRGLPIDAVSDSINVN